jgi:ribosomal protein L7/L12
MARLLLILAAILLLLFGLGYLGAPRQNGSFIIFAGLLFLLAIASGRRSAQKPLADVSEDRLEPVYALIEQGKKIEAIGYYRELTGSSLKEAKDYVERLTNLNAKPQPSSIPLSSELEDAIRTLKEKSKIEAIREVRNLTGLSLREAKDYVDEL